jgi:hypothetical protein
MRHSAAILAIACLPAAAVAQDNFEGVIAYDMTAAGNTMQIRQMTRGVMVRQEMQGPMGEMVTLASVEGREMTTLLPAQKMYMRINMDDMLARVQQMQQQQPLDPEPADFKATGRKETIAGHTCEHYEYTSGETSVDVCVAGGLGFVPFSAGSAGSTSTAAKLEEWKRHFRGGYLPLSMVASGSGMTMTMTATSVEQKSLSPDLFEVPEGYTEMKLPGGE